MNKKWIIGQFLLLAQIVKDSGNTKDEKLVLILKINEILAYLVYGSIIKNIGTPDEYRSIGKQTLSQVIGNQTDRENRPVETKENKTQLLE